MILVFGTLCIDRTRTIGKLPRAGGYAEILSERVALGGEAANTAWSLMHWGADFRLAGNPMGHDPNGSLLFDLLEKSGLPMSHLERRDAITPVCDIYVTPNGDRTMFGVGFATITDCLHPASAPYQSNGWFTLDSNLRASGNEALRLAQKAGMKLYVMDIVEPDLTLHPGDCWQCSTDWAGESGNMEANIQWLTDWIERHGCQAVLTDGSRGLIAGTPEIKPRYFKAYPCPSPVDSTGAGDMFRAAMLFQLAHGKPFLDSLSFASAAGCLKCMRLGAISEVPTQAEIEAHIAAHPEISSQFQA